MTDISLFPRGNPHKSDRANISPNSTWLAPEIVQESDHWRYETGKILLGKIGANLIGVRDDRHLVTIAGSRAGKGVSAIIPNLLTYTGSVLCIDPKGENASITARRRKELGQTVYVLDPFKTSGLPSSSFNPLSIIDTDSETCVDDAALIADGIIIQEGGNAKHWTSGARNLLRGILLYLKAHEATEQQTLIRMRELLTASGAEQADFLKKMMASKACYGVIARTANALVQKDSREMSGIISTAIEQTDFLDSPAMRDVLTETDFELSSLKREKISVFLCLPAGRMATHNRWLRIMINLVIESMERYSAPPEGEPVLVIMDEFPILGHMEAVEKAAGLIAGYGVRLWTIIQDLSQLVKHYEKSWETFLGNAGVVQLFGNTDLTTLKYASERIGQATVTNISKSEISIQQSVNGFSGESVNYSIAPLMTPEEISRFFSRQQDRQLLLWSGVNPIAIDRIKFFEHEFFKGHFDEKKPQPSPKFGEGSAPISKPMPTGFMDRPSY